MADNTTFQTTLASPPSGLVIATDDVAGVHFQKIKLDIGGDGATAILGNANPLPVSDAGGSLTVDGTVTAVLDTATFAGKVAIVADYDSGGGTQNMPLVGVAVPASGGGVAGGTFTNPFRIDPTATTAQPITDNGGSITIDGSVGLTGALPAGNNNIGDVDVASIAAGDNLIGRFKLTDGSTVADVFDYTNSNPLAVRLSDTNGDYVSAGAGTQYTEDAAAPADPVGSAIMATRDDQLSVVTEVEGDWSRLRSSNKGALWVTIPDASGDPITSFGGGTQYTEDVVSAADPVGNALILRRRDTLSGAEVSADGDNIAANASNKGELYVKHVDSVPVTDNGGSLTVDGTVTANLAAGTNNIGDVDVLSVPADPFGVNADAASATGSISAKLRFIASTGIPITGTVTVGSHAVTNAGTFAVQVSSALPTGANVIGALAANQSVNVAQINGITPLMGAGNTGTGSPRVTIASDQATIPVSLASVPSHAVTNVGTFAVQNTAATPAGTNNIGDVDVLSIVGAGTIATNQVSVAATATLIVAARAGRRAVTIIQHGSTNVFFGATSGVTVSNGALLLGTAGSTVTLDYTGDVYGIAASGSVTVSFLEEY